MAYTPTEWERGDTITAEKLNKLEEGLAECCGGGSEPLILSYTTEDVPCPSDPSKTTQKKTYNYSWQEIHDALLSGKQIFYINHGYGIPTTVEQYQIDLVVGGAGTFYVDSTGHGNRTFSFAFADATSKEYTVDCASHPK